MKCWIKGKRILNEIGTNKLPSAWSFVTRCQGIRLSAQELQQLGLRNRTPEELRRLTLHQAAALLEKRGWTFTTLTNS